MFISSVHRAGAPPTGARRRVTRQALAGAAVAFAAAVLAPKPAPAAAAENAAADAPAGGDKAGEVRAGEVRAMTEDLDISPAQARQRLSTQDATVALADRLSDALGSRAAGTFIDRESGRLVVNVTSAATADRVRSAGARPRVVEHSTGRLHDIQRALQRESVTGATLSVDVKDNVVEVTVPERSNADTRAFLRQARSFGDAVEVTRVSGIPRTAALHGGEAITGGQGRCSAGFVAEGGYVITAGHCTDAISSWDTGEGHLGSSVESDFPGDDYGLIRIEGSVDAAGAVVDGSGTTDITGAGTPPVGTYLCKSGSTTGTTCGTIRGYDATVDYPSGKVSGLIETDICSQGGDSGGALFDGGTAVGVVSGGTDTGCSSSSFRSYFQPVEEALDAYGLTLK